MVGETYHGKLIEAEDNMNVLMESCTVTYRNGQTARLENVFIRGSKIRFLILPDMLKNAPMFKNMTGCTEGRGGGGGNFGKSAILRGFELKLEVVVEEVAAVVVVMVGGGPPMRR